MNSAALEPAEAWPIVQDAILAFRAKVPDMAYARHALAKVLSTGAWSRYDSPTGKRVLYEDFAEWVTRPVPTGLETSVENLWEIAKGDRELTKELQKAGLPDLAKNGAIGNGRSVDNVKATQGGNSETYIIRRLKRDHPDLAELVLDGKETARAAGIAAGFIKPTITVPIDPDRLAPILRKKLDPAALDRLRELLG